LNASPPGLYVVGDRNATVKTRAFIRTDGGFVTRFDFGGDEEDEDDVVGAREAVEEPGRGAIGIATSPVLLCAGYPSHCLPDRTHLIHCGRVSSHLTLRFLVKGRKQKRGRSPGVASSNSLAVITPRLDLWPTGPPLPRRFRGAANIGHLEGLRRPSAFLDGNRSFALLSSLCKPRRVCFGSRAMFLL
jgi:hypothetical protein